MRVEKRDWGKKKKPTTGKKEQEFHGHKTSKIMIFTYLTIEFIQLLWEF